MCLCIDPILLVSNLGPISQCLCRWPVGGWSMARTFGVINKKLEEFRESLPSGVPIREGQHRDCLEKVSQVEEGCLEGYYGWWRCEKYVCVPSVGYWVHAKKAEAYSFCADLQQSNREVVSSLGGELGALVGRGPRVGQYPIVCSSDTHLLDVIWQRFPQKVRTLINSITFETANKPIKCTKGCTVKYGAWDVLIDVSLSFGAPSSLSIGHRVMEAGMSCFWMAGRKPCMIRRVYDIS